MQMPLTCPLGRGCIQSPATLEASDIFTTTLNVLCSDAYFPFSSRLRVTPVGQPLLLAREDGFPSTWAGLLEELGEAAAPPSGSE